MQERGYNAFSAKPLSRTAQGCPGKLFLQEQWVIDTHITPKSSCADLIRASTPLFRLLQGVDGRAKPGQDEVIRPISFLFGRKIFPGQPCRKRGEGEGVAVPSPRESGERVRVRVRGAEG